MPVRPSASWPAARLKEGSVIRRPVPTRAQAAPVRCSLPVERPQPHALASTLVSALSLPFGQSVSATPAGSLRSQDQARLQLTVELGTGLAPQALSPLRVIEVQRRAEERRKRYQTLSASALLTR